MAGETIRLGEGGQMLTAARDGCMWHRVRPVFSAGAKRTTPEAGVSHSVSEFGFNHPPAGVFLAIVRVLQSALQTPDLLSPAVLAAGKPALV
jgi:hypothetical protein